MKKLYNRTALFHARAIVGLFALCLLALPSPALAQAIDLKLTNVTVKEAIEALNQRENYSVAIKSAGVDMQRRVSISAQNASIDEVLAQIFADQDITYTITGKSISVTKAAPKSLAADKNQLKGVVKDNLGLPVPGATIIVDGTNNGTTTMSNGDFSLENVKLPAKLVISFIGYQPRTVEVNSYAAIDITLVESSAAIDEVVVVGYGQQKRVNVTGAVGTISGKDLNNRPVTNTAAALQGADPSLLLTLGSGSIEGKNYDVKIRGAVSLNSGSPLVLVDGIEASLAQVNPNDIESVSVLKDASACSIYGAKASAGVVLITTKSGKAGTLKVNYNGRYGVSWNTTSTDFITSGYDYVKLTNEFCYPSKGYVAGTTRTRRCRCSTTAATTRPSIPTARGSSPTATANTAIWATSTGTTTCSSAAVPKPSTTFRSRAATTRSTTTSAAATSTVKACSTMAPRISTTATRSARRSPPK